MKNVPAFFAEKRGDRLRWAKRSQSVCCLLQTFWRLAKTLHWPIWLLLLGAVRIAALTHVAFLLAVHIVGLLFHVHSSSGQNTQLVYAVLCTLIPARKFASLFQ